MNVVIFTEAGPEYGYGHLMRCLALAEGFKEHYSNILFILRGEGDFAVLLKDYTFVLENWLEPASLANYLCKVDIAIVDSYYADKQICRTIYNGFFKVLFFDDIQRINYPGGYVLNGVIGAELMNYPANSSLTYLLGVDFQPLRKEFWNVPSFHVRDDIDHVLITFGGSDVTNQTPVYMQKIREILPECKISVIIGNGFIHSDFFEQLVDEKIRIVYSPNAIIMRNLMLDCDLAISAAGQTISELARIGTPAIGVQVVDNQKINIKNWCDSGFLLSERILDSPISSNLRLQCSEAGRKIIDGQGVKRIVEMFIC